MKRVLILLGIILAIVLVYWLVVKKDANTVENVKPAPLSVATQTGTFNVAFANLLNNYYDLKDAFVDWDTVKVNKSAAKLKELADGLPVKEIKADTTLVKMAGDYAKTISNESAGIAGDPDITEKRKSFYTLSESLYELIRTVRFNGGVVYHQHCPMAFGDNDEATWLSNSNKVVNPYLGNKHPKYRGTMVNCGDVTDSLDFRNK
jgi:hypothetical protein